jgi:hypothetical protein
MVLDVVTKGTTNYSCTIRIVDSSDGTPETGVVFNTAGIDLWYRRPGGAHSSITEATQTEGGAHTDGGFVHISDGYYRLDLPDAAVATGVDYVDVGGTVTGMVVIGGRIRLTDVDLSDAVRGGMTALPNANADAAGGLAISDAGGLDLDAILVDTNSLNDTKIPDTISLAAINAQVDTALTDIGLDHLVSTSVIGTDVADNSIFARLVSSAATADWDTYDNTTDSLQSLRDRGDAAWTTGGGGSITDLLSVEYNIPPAIDLANTASWRIGMSLTNALDDLPTTAEITPGTISIRRKSQGGTSWSAVVTDAAMSETDGQIYYDEVFDTGTGYAAGDVLEFTFKSQKITVSANDYEINGTTGTLKYGAIIADTPDVNVAQINGSSANVAAANLFFSVLDAGTGQIDAGTLASDTLTAAKVQDGALTAAKFGAGFITAAAVATDAIDADAIAADAVTEIQSGLATASALTTVDGVVDAILVDTGTTLPALFGTPAGASVSADIAAIKTVADAVEADTQNIQSRLPTSLNNGAMIADIQRINDVALTGDGSATPFTV